MKNRIDSKGINDAATPADDLGRIRRRYGKLCLALLAVVIATSAFLAARQIAEPVPVRAQTIPSDASNTFGCPVSSTTFAGWFQSGAPAVNGVVNPADSLTFTPSLGLCSFYAWSEQMYLWLLSPAPSTYGGGAHIFDSPTFYDVSPLNSSDQRTLTKHVSGHFPIVGIKVPIPGPHGLPVIMDTHHRLFEIEPAKIASSGRQLILNSAGKEVEVENITVANGKAVFTDPKGKTILRPRPILRPELLKPVIVPKASARVAPESKEEAMIRPPARQVAAPQVAQRFMIHGRPILINPVGVIITPVNPEEGQATTGDSLLSQTTAGTSLVYYTIVVNDVYAYFLTGNKTGGITPAATDFPNDSTGLTAVTNYATTKGVTFPDPNALAVEVKMSWVDAATLPDASSYITVSATVPNYDTTNPSQWVPTGTKNITLALVGIHFVGTVLGHPEMIWASFEHFGNTPNPAYSYTTTSGSTGNVAQDTTGAWLFCTTNCPIGTAFNSPHARVSGSNIVGVPSGSPISPSNTQRTNPWGLDPTQTSSTGSNTQIVSINHSVLTQLLAGDMRKNYFMLGATWTAGGAPPSSGAQVGTNFLANSTMETYVQGGSNCFSCHNDGGASGGMLGTGTDSGLSHIYFPIQPLP